MRYELILLSGLQTLWPPSTSQRNGEIFLGILIVCGICGKYSPAGVRQEELGIMLHTIAHRGPDDSGDYFSQKNGTRLGLAHRRLSIIDLSQMGHQPMWDPSGSVAITYNGEIYNFRQLRGNSRKKGSNLGVHPIPKS